ncbi:hypothetical protein PR048_007507 [Dryococelus australis]|uniref:BTB domain-containing protein n=1 Tax=Dryococelus australis TaxID=614101 RepID=A0ABQ9HUV8_9NEOP|nr:hypothetical protein PR048_007507 [Dryococelus australis]
MATGETEQMLLHWNNFHSSMAGSFHEFREREELVDMTLVARDGSLQAHRLLLSAGSPYLQHLLEASPCDHPVLILGDVGHRELLGILEFMYRGEVQLAQADLGAFLQAAEMLQVKGLTGSEVRVPH